MLKKLNQINIYKSTIIAQTTVRLLFRVDYECQLLRYFIFYTSLYTCYSRIPLIQYQTGIFVIIFQ